MNSIYKLSIIMLAATATSLAAAQNDKMTPIDIPKQRNAIVLGTGKLPEATAEEAWHSQYGSKFARNVSIATLTPFLPAKSRATGAAVIVAPGGGFRTLSMENEGWQVAQALAKKGVAAFVLKYRLNPTRRRPSDPKSRTPPPPSPSSDPARPSGTSTPIRSGWLASPPARC